MFLSFSFRLNVCEDKSVSVGMRVRVESDDPEERFALALQMCEVHDQIQTKNRHKCLHAVRCEMNVDSSSEMLKCWSY